MHDVVTAALIPFKLEVKGFQIETCFSGEETDQKVLWMK